MFSNFAVILVLVAATYSRSTVPTAPDDGLVSKPIRDTVVEGFQPIYDYITEGVGAESPILPSDWSYQCPKPFGFFRYEGIGSCDIYIECRNFQASLKVCPDGMHFKTFPRWSEYPCAYPPEAVCIGRENALPPRPTAECPRQFGNFPITGSELSRYDQCSKYVSCASGVPHVMNCTFGLVFNPVLRQCDWPERVPDCQDAFEFHCPTPHLGEETTVFNYRYPNDPECRYFYSCLNGGYRVLACDEGLLFDHRRGRCVEYDQFVCDGEQP